MHNSLKVGSWVSIGAGCGIRYKLQGDEVVSFVFGVAPDDDLDICIDTEALRAFLKLGTEALSELDAQLARKEAERAQRQQAADARELVTAGERSA